MYTAIAQTQNINIEASLLLVEEQTRRRDLINIISCSTLWLPILRLSGTK